MMLMLIQILKEKINLYNIKKAIKVGQWVITICTVFALAVPAQAQVRTILGNQRLDLDHANRRRMPLILVFAHPDRVVQVEKAIEALPENKRPQQHFAIAEKAGTQTNTALNNLLNGPEKYLFDKQRIYLLRVGTATSMPSDDLDHTIFADQATQVLADSAQVFDLLPILEKFSKNYLWEIRLEVLESQFFKVSHQQKKRGFGITLGQHAQSAYAADSVTLPNNLIKYGLAFYGDRGAHWQWETSLMTSFKIPNRSKIQSQIFNQIDIGYEGEQAIEATIKMHILVQAAVQANYLFKPYHGWQPYVGAGLGFNFFTAGGATIKDTIDFSGGFSGGPPDFGDAGENPRDNMRLLLHNYVSPQLSLGTYYTLGKHLQLALHADYHPLQGQAKIKGDEVRSGLGPISANVGLRFVFGKSKRYYYYFREGERRP
jgi:hypothetical protein